MLDGLGRLSLHQRASNRMSVLWVWPHETLGHCINSEPKSGLARRGGKRGARGEGEDERAPSMRSLHVAGRHADATPPRPAGAYLPSALDIVTRSITAERADPLLLLPYKARSVGVGVITRPHPTARKELAEFQFHAQAVRL